MSVLDRQIATARRRLNTNTLLHFLALGVIAAAGVYAAVVGIQRTLWPALPLAWAAVGAGGLALLVAIVGMAWQRATPLVAAVSIDAAARLKERLSTALVVRRNLEDPFARAAVADAEQAAARVHVPAHLPLRTPPLLPWSLASLAAAGLLALLLPNMDLLAKTRGASAAATADAQTEERQQVAQQWQQQLSRVAEKAQDNPALADLAAELKPLEFPLTANLTPEDLRREAIKKVDDLRDRVAEQAKQGQLDALRMAQRQLERLEPQRGSNPAARLSQALASGDPSAAKEALSEMQKQLEEAMQKADDPAVQQQLQEMSAQLRKLADQIAELNDSVRIQRDLEQAGLTPEQARELAQQARNMDREALEQALQQQLGEKGLSKQQMQELVEKLQQQAQSQKTLEQLQQSLSQAAQAMQQSNQSGSQGQGQAADQALSDAMGQLSEMEMAEQMMNELQAQLSELNSLREAMSGNCGGCGNCGSCQGGQPGGSGEQGGNAGQGWGERVGRQKAAHDMKAEKAKVRVTRGQIIGQMLIDGPQVRGELSSSVQEALVAAQREAEDAIDRNAVPRQYERITREYFERLAGLIAQERAAGAAPAAPPPPKPATPPAPAPPGAQQR